MTNTSSGGGDGDRDGDGDEHVDEFKCSSDLKTLKFIEKSIQEENRFDCYYGRFN